MAKGEVRVRESGCELNVFTFCLYHSKLLRSAEDNKQNKNARRYGKDGVIIERWKEAWKLDNPGRLNNDNLWTCFICGKKTFTQWDCCWMCGSLKSKTYGRKYKF